ncbi:hypothetical protein LTR85_001519 [Meristemomyces frigidus]|nr:hypothetical protein LTR85_001519 [Meristemomyces frigidus]
MYDVLEGVNTSIRETHPAFEIYRNQRRLRDAGWSLQQISNASNIDDPSHKAAWELDKFKFLHTLNKVHGEWPDKDWYVFVEADTYMNWPNLFAWLEQLDHTTELYIGSPSFMGGIKFNHGGSGYVLSGPALRRFAAEHPGMATEWDERTSKECCGDYVLTLALKELGIPVSGVWPMLSGECPLGTPFGPALWCQPVITMHHVTPNDVQEMWSFEEAFTKENRPMLFEDLYNHWLPGGLPESRLDWDNRCPGSVFDIGAPEHSAESLDALYKCFTLGKAAAASDGKVWHSVWRLNRINSWIEAHASCTNAAWTPVSTDNARFGGVV